MTVDLDKLEQLARAAGPDWDGRIEPLAAWRDAASPIAVLVLVQRLQAAAARARACPMCGFVWSEPGPCPTCVKRLKTAEAIVRDLAASERRVTTGHGESGCDRCGAPEGHTAACLVGRAVEAMKP